MKSVIVILLGIVVMSSSLEVQAAVAGTVNRPTDGGGALVRNGLSKDDAKTSTPKPMPSNTKQ